MGNEDTICKFCGKPLKASQYLRRKNDGQPPVKESETLVCRNYPNCPKAEKDIIRK